MSVKRPFWALVRIFMLIYLAEFSELSLLDILLDRVSGCKRSKQNERCAMVII
jgi:hypothetical protein